MPRRIGILFVTEAFPYEWAQESVTNIRNSGDSAPIYLRVLPPHLVRTPLSILDHIISKALRPGEVKVDAPLADKSAVVIPPEREEYTASDVTRN